MAAPRGRSRAQIYPDFEFFLTEGIGKGERNRQIQRCLEMAASSTIDRRTLLGRMATLGAGIAGSMVAPPEVARGFSTCPAHGSGKRDGPLRDQQSRCLRRCNSGGDKCGEDSRIERNGVYIFKGVPYGASTSGAGALCRQKNRSLGWDPQRVGIWPRLSTTRFVPLPHGWQKPGERRRI